MKFYKIYTLWVSKIAIFLYFRVKGKAQFSELHVSFYRESPRFPGPIAFDGNSLKNFLKQPADTKVRVM